MAFFDQTLLLSSAQAITSTAVSTNIYDVTGAGSGNAPALIWGTSTVFGADIGVGDGVAVPYLYMSIPTTFTTSSSATLQVQVQAAIDNGSNSPGSYTTIVETDAFAVTPLVAGKVLLLPIPPITLGESLPRFYRINYVVGTGTFTAGAVTSVILLNPPSKLENTLYPSNFTSV